MAGAHSLSANWSMMRLNVLKGTSLARASACHGSRCSLVGVEASSEGASSKTVIYIVLSLPQRSGQGAA